MERLHWLYDRAAALVPPTLADAAAPYIAKSVQAAQELSGAASGRLQPVIGYIIDQSRPHWDRFTAQLDELAQSYQPWQVVLATALLTATALLVLLRVNRYFRRVTEGGVVQWVFSVLRSLPLVSTLVGAPIQKAMREVAEKLHAPGEESMTELPLKGTGSGTLVAMLRQRSHKDVMFRDGQSSASGTVYMSGEQHKQLLDEAYCMFSYSNPLHADIFPSVRKMEAEVVAMTASLLAGGLYGNRKVCGAMTSGGSESILLAMKASRDFMRASKGITEPEMIVAGSAHAAYWKAAEYFQIKLVQVPVGKDYRLSAATVRRHMTRNTAIVVASAPGFPHGVVDHIEDIAALCRRRGVMLHVDACLGGFVLPFAKKLGYDIPNFDFSVPGVTSMSVDTHKFGMAHKGTSVVLYHDPALRRFQYTSITEWSGGLYISPTMAGSRPGALIATAWASMVHLGLEGYLMATKDIMEAAVAFRRGLQQIPHLEVMGEPEMSVVAFRSTSSSLNVYKLNDLMTRKGWHLNALQGPPALHFCFTAAHVQVVDLLCSDLRACVDVLLESPDCVSGGTAPLYGVAGISPDRGFIAEFLVAYQDTMLNTC